MPGRLSSQGRGRLASKAEDLSTVAGLESFAEKKGVEVPKESKVKNVLSGVSRVLNVGTATVSGAVHGALSPELTVYQGVQEGLKRNMGFSDVIREDLGYNPTSRLGKAAVGTAGFVADVLFDPITYLTFGTGAGLKLGGKTLSKEASKAALELSSNVIKGASKADQLRLAGKSVGEILEETVPDYLKKIESRSGGKAFDEGGIKFAGRQLVKGSTIAGTPVGRATKALGQTETAQNVKNALGKMFSYGYGKDPKFLDLMEKGATKTYRTIRGLDISTKNLFKDLNPTERREFFDTVFSKKSEVLTRTKDIQQSTIDDLNKAFPELKIDSSERAARVLDALEEKTVGEVSKIRQRIEEIVKPVFAERQAAIKAGKTFTEKPMLSKGGKGLSGVDALNRQVDELKQLLKEIRAGKAKGAAVEKRVIDLGGPITKDELHVAGKKLIDYEEERLRKVIDDLSEKIERTKTAATIGTQAGVKVPFKSLTAEETIAYGERKILKLQNELAEKSGLLGKVLDARKLAKASQRGEKLVFSNPKLQKISDKLFEGEGAIVKKLAKEANIPESEVIKFYIPSKFSDKVGKEGFFSPSLRSDLGFQKKFTGVEKNLIRDPYEAYLRGRTAVATARIKGETATSVIRNLGRPIEELAEHEAAELGLKKFSRNTIQGKIEGWVPESIVDDLNQLFDPKKGGLSLIDDLARVSGFDYVTGLFKGYVTSLFPGFHIRNMVSNQFQNMLKIGVDVLNPAIQKRAVDIALGRNLGDVLITKTGQKITNKEIRRLVEHNSDILTSGKYINLEQMIEESQQAAKGFNKFNPLSRTNVALEAGRSVGTKVEAKDKLVSIISGLLEGKGINESVKQAEEALFNYRKLAPFEKTVMRRIIPFYTFARKNAELQIKALAKNPGRIASELKAVRGVGEAVGEPITDKDREGLPGYVLDSLGIKAGVNQYGQNVFMTGLGLPIEEFINRFSGDKSIIWNSVKNVITESNPVVRYGVERATGQDFFRERPITQITNAENLKSFIDLMPEKIGTQFKSLVNWHEIPNQPVYANGKVVARETKYVANPFALHFIRNLPTSRIVTTGGFVTDPSEPAWNRALRFFTGVKGYAIDQEEQKFYNELKRKRELEDWLVNMKVIKKLEKAYVPKPK